MQKAHLVSLISQHNSPRHQTQNGWNKMHGTTLWMNAQFPTTKLTVDQIRDQKQQLKRTCIILKKLSEMNVFEWDYDNHKLTTPNYVWKLLLEVWLISYIIFMNIRHRLVLNKYVGWQRSKKMT